MKTLITDKTKSLYSDNCFLTNNEQYRLGEIGLFKGRKFVLLPGHQYSDPFAREDGKKINVFKYRALMLDRNGKSTATVDGVKLSDLVKTTYGKCERGEDGKLLPYPKIESTFSRNGNIIPTSFGTTILNCGWDIKKVYSGEDSVGNKLFNGVIEKPQAFEVVDVELHWLSEYDEVKNGVKIDEDGCVVMRPRLVSIIQRIEVPEGLDAEIKAAQL